LSDRINIYQAKPCPDTKPGCFKNKTVENVESFSSEFEEFNCQQ